MGSFIDHRTCLDGQAQLVSLDKTLSHGSCQLAFRFLGGRHGPREIEKFHNVFSASLAYKDGSMVMSGPSARKLADLICQTEASDTAAAMLLTVHVVAAQ